MTKVDFKNILKNIDFADLKQKAKNLKRHKWCLIVAGIVMGLLGICSMFHSDKSLLCFAMFLGFGFVITGISHIFVHREYKNDSVDYPCWFLVQGIYEIILGVILVANIGVTFFTVPIMIVFWAILDGVMRTTASCKFKKAGVEKWRILCWTGTSSIVFALILLIHPFTSFFSASFLIGLTLLAWGITAKFEALHFYD